MVSERPSPAVQDYLKAIYGLAEAPGEGVTTTRVAASLGVTTASASNMLRRLDGLGYVAQRGRGEFALTPAGRSAALEVIRHHRLLETYLAQHLGVPLADVHREAEILEHHLSEELEARIADVLGHPEMDPHGDPIPSLAGDVTPVAATCLAELPVGARGAIVRVSDRDADLLRFLECNRLVPGARLEVVERPPFGGGLVVRAGGGLVQVPPLAAEAVFVA